MKEKIKSLIRLAWPYILLVLLPILSVIFLSGYILSNHTQRMVADQNRVLEAAAERVDQKIAAIEELSYLISENETVYQYVVNGMAGIENDYYAEDRIRDLLNGVSQNDNIAEIYFYDVTTQKIIASKVALSEPEMFFRYRYQIQGTTPEQAVKELRTSDWNSGYTEAKEILLSNMPLEVIEYHLSLPTGRYGDRQSRLIISLNVDSLFQDFLDAVGENGTFYVYEADTLIYGSDQIKEEYTSVQLTKELQQTTLKGKPYAAQYSINGGSWTVRCFYPSIPQAEDGQLIMRRLVPAILLPLVLSMILCFYFTHKNHKEITETLNILRGEEAQDAEQSYYVSHEMIRSYAGHMAQTNTTYQTKLQEARISQRSSVLSRFLRNAYRSGAEKEKALASVELQIGKEKCAALCVQFDEICNEYFTADDVTARQLIVDLMVTYASLKLEILDSMPTEIVAVMAVEEGYEQVLDDIISILNVRIAYEYGMDVRIGIGNPVNSIFDIHHSYEQAKEVIRYGESVGRNVRIFDQMDGLEEVVFYPVMTDDKISNYMIAGRSEEAKNVIMNIYNENFCDSGKMLSLEAVALVRYRVIKAVTTVAEKQGISIPADMKKILTEKNVSKYFAALTDMVDQIVEKIMTKKSNAQNVLAVKVRDYIQQHYMECGLSVKQIANSLHFHENYISNLYKEEYGENLSNAIEQLRIEKASELLRTTDIRIGEVAAAVGYSSDSSFRRAFKKITGVSPVDYRTSH